MFVLKKYLKILLFLVIGFVLTENVLRVVYEYFGILFQGNVWVNWFGVSYLLYFFYTIFHVLFINKNNYLYQERIRFISFWVFFIGSVYVVCIPFIKGENPF